MCVIFDENRNRRARNDHRVMMIKTKVAHVCTAQRRLITN
jgi:hypothetical protein